MSHPLRPRILTAGSFTRAVAGLARRDPWLAHAVARWGPPPFWTHPPGFPGLVLAILSQQVSLGSAQAAFARLGQQVRPVTPEGFLALDGAALRAVGFSRQKAGYVRGLAGAILAGELHLEALDRMEDGTARAALQQLKGIGPWTADTYLLFALRRPDAWPSGDLALISAIRDLSDSHNAPGSAEADGIAERWRPWRAVAARILWHHYLGVRGRSATWNAGANC